MAKQHDVESTIICPVPADQPPNSDKFILSIKRDFLCVTTHPPFFLRFIRLLMGNKILGDRPANRQPQTSQLASLAKRCSKRSIDPSWFHAVSASLPPTKTLKKAISWKQFQKNLPQTQSQKILSWKSCDLITYSIIYSNQNVAHDVPTFESGSETTCCVPFRSVKDTPWRGNR